MAKQQIFLPYTEILGATTISLIGYNYKPVKLVGKTAYSYYFKDRWDDGEGFINVEHDCIPWPGAIESLWNCPSFWCAFDYSLPAHRGRLLADEVNSVPMGLMKISAEVIDLLPGIWDEPVDWEYCDQNLTKHATKRFNVCQHFPGIVNANNVILESL